MNIIRLLNRIPNLFLLFIAISATALFEGIGIASLIPVISFITSDTNIDELIFPFSILPDFLIFIGLEINLINMLFFVFCLMIISFFSIYVQELIIQYNRYKILYDNRQELGLSLFRSNWVNGLKLSSGDVSNKLVHETDKLAETLMSLILLISLGVQFLIYIIVALYLSVSMTLLVAIIILISFITIYPLLQKSKKLGAQVVHTNSSYSKQVVDAVKGFKLVKASGLEKYIISKLSKVNWNNSKFSRKLLDYASGIKFLVQACLSLAIVFIAYLSLEILQLELSKLMVFLLILIRIVPKYSSVQGAYRSFLVNYPALEIVDSMKHESDQNIEQLNVKNGEYKIMKDKISIKNIEYAYNRNDKFKLSDISFDIDHNSFIAIVGPSGSGKSTLLDLIMGLLKPDDGTIFIDDKNLSSLNLEEHRNKIGFVPQENIFFNGTIRENLIFDKKENENFLYDCLKISQLDNFVRNLPNKLSQNIGEGGVNLSGGQRQRLSIARALARKPSILILDEATSSLDTKSEISFQKALEEISDKYTLIVVAHRLSTIKKANKIIVLDQGRIVEKGNYEELKLSGGIFSSMIKSQLIN